MSPRGYSSVRSWLNEQAIALGEMGYLVEFQHSADFLRLRVEGLALIGELSVWETMKADAMVSELVNGSFVFESYGATIGLHPIEEEFKTFFGYFPKALSN